MRHINYQSTHKFYLTYGSLLQEHYPLPTDYRNHGVVLSPRVKFFMVTLARICNHHSVDLPPITASTPQSYLVEFRILMWCGFEPHIKRALFTLEGIEPIGITQMFLIHMPVSCPSVAYPFAYTSIVGVPRLTQIQGLEP